MSVRRLEPGSPDFKKGLELRLSVLVRPFGIDPQEATADDADSHHLALFEEGRCVAVLLLCPRQENVFQMRQVAVEPAKRRSGLGRLLMRESEAYAKSLGAKLIWANIRESAEGFYLDSGYELSKESYELVGLPHRRAEKHLE